ncbi:hypothetical protein [Paenibacillus sp. CF384]|uniref:hypothetical protein n=1 Tax=Paenibacillus sp. CF384 TaxID=1884382 RepID=UPI00089684DF|nr:hypothetical protein [Paenibacillus sp. CF384]SDW85390.1 hypothetical protein SAMN05518855_100615 [Paenibacillus sp. CF384]
MNDDQQDKPLYYDGSGHLPLPSKSEQSKELSDSERSDLTQPLQMRTVTFDFEFDHSMWFGSHVIVERDGVIVGSGLVEEYNEHDVRIERDWHPRRLSSFKISPSTSKR